MNTNQKNDDLIKAILKEAHNEIQPRDSWEALRARIDKRVCDEERYSVSIKRVGRNATFWRRIALAMAACLVITTGLLIYLLDNSQSGQQEQINLANQGLLNQRQLDQLSIAFSHVRELFETHCPWMVIDSGGEGEIGVDYRTAEATDANKIIIIRLAVNVEGQEVQRRYFDVVTFSNQQVSFSASIADSSDIGISIKPMITHDGTIEIEVKVGLESGPQTGDFVTVADDKFTSLVRVKSNSNWVNIDATGQLASNI